MLICKEQGCHCYKNWCHSWIRKALTLRSSGISFSYSENPSHGLIHAHRRLQSLVRKTYMKPFAHQWILGKEILMFLEEKQRISSQG